MERAGDGAEQSGFTASRGANDHQKLPFTRVKVHPLESLGARFACAKSFRHIADMHGIAVLVGD
jgi:hypothetical protein